MTGAQQFTMLVLGLLVLTTVLVAIYVWDES